MDGEKSENKNTLPIWTLPHLGTLRAQALIGAVVFAIASIVFLAMHNSMRGYAFLMGACLLCAVYIIGRRFIGAKSKAERTVFALALAILFCGVLINNHYRSTVRLYKNVQIRTWNIYHYFIGSKYFDELGYTDLYLQTLLADEEDIGRLHKVRRVRDLEDYIPKHINKILPETHSDKFSDERWEEFKKDLRPLLKKASPRVWSHILMDRGYNPTPFWNTVGAFLSERFDFSKKSHIFIATGIDFATYIAIIAVVAWAFGAEAAMLLFLAFALLPFNGPRMIGGYIQYDWFAAIVIGICLIKKRRPILAALSMSFAVMAKVFPLIMTAGLGIPGLRNLILSRKIERFHLIFAVSFLIFCLIGVGLGCLSGGGFNSWLEWKSNIKTHNEHMETGEGRVGLKHLFTHKLGEKIKFENIPQRIRTLKKQAGYYYASAAVFFFLFFAAAYLRNDVNSVLLAMVVFFILLVPSHYYWSVLSCFVLWQLKDKENEAWSPAIIPCLIAFLVPAGYYQYAMHQKNPLAVYIRFDWLLAIGLLVLMTVLAVENIIETKKRLTMAKKS